MFKVNNRSTRHHFGIFNVNFEYIGQVVLEQVFFYSEHVNVKWNTLLPSSKFIWTLGAL